METEENSGCKESACNGWGEEHEGSGDCVDCDLDQVMQFAGKLDELPQEYNKLLSLFDTRKHTLLDIFTCDPSFLELVRDYPAVALLVAAEVEDKGGSYRDYMGKPVTDVLKRLGGSGSDEERIAFSKIQVERWNSGIERNRTCPLTPPVLSRVEVSASSQSKLVLS